MAPNDLKFTIAKLLLIFYSVNRGSLKQENLMKDFIGTMLSQPRHQLDIVEPELAYSKEQIAEELTYGSTLVKVSGLKAFITQILNSLIM